MPDFDLEMYLKNKTALFRKDQPIQIQRLCQENDKYVEGYLNFVYRVSQNGKSYIVKHSKLEIASGISLGTLDPRRNYVEYLTYQLRRGLAPQRVPEVYFGDPEMNLFIMEDLGGMSLLRFALTGNKIGWDFGEQIGDFLAHCHFFTSPFYLKGNLVVEMQERFENSVMRDVILEFILAKEGESAFAPDPMDRALRKIRHDLVTDPTIASEWDGLHQGFNKRECLIHGDFHTSNVFADDHQIKAIDMEYTMTGPFSYDLGYFLANLVTQYAAYTVGPARNKGGSGEQTDYLLAMIESVYRSYFTTFKGLYKEHVGPAELRNLFIDIFQESIGYLAVANISRTANGVPFPDFDRLPEQERFIAKGLSIKICAKLLIDRHGMETPADLTKQIRRYCCEYFSKLAS